MTIIIIDNIIIIIINIIIIIIIIINIIIRPPGSSALAMARQHIIDHLQLLGWQVSDCDSIHIDDGRSLKLMIGSKLFKAELKSLYLSNCCP